MDAGSAQEIRLIQYLKGQGYRDIIHGEADVKRDLGLPAGHSCKCADAIGFLPAKKTCRRVVVAESTEPMWPRPSCNLATRRPAC